MRYQHVLRAVRDTPWAIRPEALLVIQDVIAHRVNGEPLTDTEIQARIQSARPSPLASQHGDVAVLPLFGVLMPRASLMQQMSGGTSVEQFTRDLQDLVHDDTVSTIVLNVDSPGGMTDLIPEAAQQIREARSTKRIVAVANTDAASAAYWLAAQATELVVTPSGSVGSVGVYAAHQDFSAKLEREGVQTTLISAGRFKTEGNPFEPLGEEALQAVQARVDEFYGMFLADVAAGRSVTPDAVRGGFGEGRMVTATQAVAAGMADRVDTLDGVIEQYLGQRESPARARRVAALDPPDNSTESDAPHQAATSGLSSAPDQAAQAADQSTQAAAIRVRAQWLSRHTARTTNRQEHTVSTDTITDLRGRLNNRRDRLAEIFEQAGPDLDMSLVTALDGDSATKVEAIAALNREMDDLQAQVQARTDLQAARDRLEESQQVDRLAIHPTPGGGDRKAERRETIGQMFVNSQAYRGYQPGSLSAGPMSTFDVDMRATLFQTGAGFAPEVTRTGRIEYVPLRPAPAIIDFIPEFQTGQAGVKYMLETTHTDNTAEVAEGAVYGEAAFALTEQNVTVRKIGTWLPVTDEQLADEAEARSYIDNRLTYQLSRRVDQQVLVGSGSGVNLTGTENVVGIQTQALGGDPIFDAAMKLFRKIRDDGFAEPSVFFIAPSRWETIALTRTADGLYILGNPAQDVPVRLWGIPGLQTTAITATKLVAGDYANYSGLYVRQGMDMQVGFQTDDFIKGRIAIRADVRVAMVHFRPKAFGVVTGL